MAQYATHHLDMKQMQKPFLYRVNLTPENLDLMQQQDHEVKGNPNFVSEFLAGSPKSDDFKLLLRRPDLVSWNEDGSAVLIPNSPYIDANSLVEDPKGYKSRSGGLALNVWFVHPKQLEESVFADPEVRKHPEKIKEIYNYAPDLERTSSAARHNEQKRIRETEAETGVPYLTSVLDLRSENVPWLKSLKAMVMENLYKEYGVTHSDKVDLFFHEVVSLETATLHLHVRVNQEISPLEKQKSLGLDEIINGLESGKSVRDMLLERKEVYHAILEGEFPMVSEGVVRVPNPFLPNRGYEKPAKGFVDSFVEMLFGSNNPPVSQSRGLA